jgi:hypothetical protein
LGARTDAHPLQDASVSCCRHSFANQGVSYRVPTSAQDESEARDHPVSLWNPGLIAEGAFGWGVVSLSHLGRS